jgi:hypothetical protein
LDSTAGANFFARTAVDTSIGVDFVDVAFRNCFNRTYGHTSATSHTDVCNYVSHDLKF